jgi:Phage Mu protein F like protein
VLQESQSEKAVLAEKLLKTHSLNEVRAKLYDLGPVAGGEAVIGQAPISMFGPAPTAPTTSTAPTAPTAPTQVFNEAQRQALIEIVQSVVSGTPKSTQVIGTTLASVSVPEATTEGAIKDDAPSVVTRLGGKDWFKRREELMTQAIVKGDEDFKPVVLDILSDMSTTLIKGVKSALAEKAAERKISKAKLRRILADLTKKKNFEETWITAQVKALESVVETGYDVSLSVPFKLPNTEQLAALRSKNEDGRRDILEERALRTFAQVSETTTEKIMSLVDRGVKEQMTVDQIVQLIVNEPSFSNVKDVNRRAETIVRTETLTATSIGQAAMMADAAEVIPDLQKMWVSMRDDRVRGKADGEYPDSKADHDGLDGTVVEHDKAFVDPRNGDKLMYPRDTAGKAESTINCRCTMIVLPKDLMKEYAG